MKSYTDTFDQLEQFFDLEKEKFSENFLEIVEQAQTLEEASAQVFNLFYSFVDQKKCETDIDYQDLVQSTLQKLITVVTKVFSEYQKPIQEQITKQKDAKFLENSQTEILRLAKLINEKMRGEQKIQPRNYIIHKLFSKNETKPGEIVEMQTELKSTEDFDISNFLSEIADIGYYLIQLSHYDQAYLDNLYNFLENANITPEEFLRLLKIKYKHRYLKNKDKKTENDEIRTYWEKFNNNRNLRLSKTKLINFIEQFVNEKGEQLRNRGLPIWDIMPEIVEKLKQNNRLIIKSETGSGKTTQIPQGLLEAGLAKTGTIRTTENRVVIARETGVRVSEELGMPVGKTVGYLTGQDKKISGETRLIYETTGVLQNVIQKNPLLKGIDVVMIDEFDERTLQQDLTIALIKKAQENGSSVKLILTSATGDLEGLKDHFQCDHIEAKGRPFPVETIWAQEEIEDLYGSIADTISAIHSEKPADEDILVFLPGKGEIEQAIRATERLKLQGINLLPFHAELEKKDMHRVFEPADGRKIVFATDIAQRGLTLGKLHVVDACLQKRMEYDPQKDCQSLVTKHISQSDSKQRAGRAGRVAPGTYYPMITAEQFSRLEKEIPPEILRVPLRSVILQIKAMGYSREEEALDFITSPLKENWKEAKNQLRLLGLLNPENETELNEKGKLVAELPCDPRDGVSLLKALEIGCEEDMAIITAIRMATKNLLYRPRNEVEQNQARSAHQQFSSNQSDFLTLLKAYKQAKGKNYQWFKDNYVSIRALREIENNLRTIQGVLRQIRHKQPLNEKKALKNKEYSLEKKLLLAIYTGNKDKVFKRSGRNYYKENDPNDCTSYVLGRESGCNDGRVLANEIIGIPTKRGDQLNLITKATVLPDNKIIEELG